MKGYMIMVIKQVSLDMVCGITSHLPDTKKPEVAFAGRSNVGKSSMINVLMNRKSLARTSQKPGKTQTINFYNVNDEMYLVDLPGYGYASTGKDEREKWGQMIEKYLNHSPNLKAVFLLADIRHAPNANDLQMYEWVIASHFQPIIIATKLDKLKRSQVNACLRTLREGFSLPPETPIIPFSAETKAGKEEIWKIIEDICF